MALKMSRRQSHGHGANGSTVFNFPRSRTSSRARHEPSPLPPAPWAAFKLAESSEEAGAYQCGSSSMSTIPSHHHSHSTDEEPDADTDVDAIIEQPPNIRFATAPTSVTITAPGHSRSNPLQWTLLSHPSIPVPSLAALASLDFNPFDWSEDSLLHSCALMLRATGCVSSFQLDWSVLCSFLVGVRAKYRANPYHNFYHGFSVMQFAYHVIQHTELPLTMPKLDVLALLVACLCHDIDHTGHTNAFEVAAASELALMHNDQAVLENHHAATTFTLLRDPSMAIFSAQHSKLSRDEIRALRKMVIACILATDMAHHFDMCRELDRQEPECASISWSDANDRQFVLNLLTHAADLSGQIAPLPVAQQWETRVTEEFRAQSQLESSIGLPLTPDFQELHIDQIRFKNHLNYIDFVLTPLWTGMVEMFPSLAPCCHNLLTNRTHWSERVAQAQAAAVPEADAVSVTLSENRLAVSHAYDESLFPLMGSVPPLSPLSLLRSHTLTQRGTTESIRDRRRRRWTDLIHTSDKLSTL